MWKQIGKFSIFIELEMIIIRKQEDKQNSGVVFFDTEINAYHLRQNWVLREIRNEL